jgi:hypothetical protein
MWPAKALIDALKTAPAPASEARRHRAVGWRVHVRPLCAGEVGPLLESFAGLGPRSRELRYGAPRLRLTDAELHQFADVDGHDHVALVAESADGSQVGVARFVLNGDSESSADIVVTMVDAWYEHGVGLLLASSLVYGARRGRQRRFPLVLRPGNEAAQRLLPYAKPLHAVRPAHADLRTPAA